MTTTAKPSEATPAQRQCPECGKWFTPKKGGPGSVQRFCEPKHQTRFHDLMARRGKVALPFVLTSRMGKRGRTEDTAYAFSQLSGLADIWNAEDKEAGRNPSLLVAAKREMEWRAVDIGR